MEVQERYLMDTLILMRVFFLETRLMQFVMKGDYIVVDAQDY